MVYEELKAFLWDFEVRAGTERRVRRPRKDTAKKIFLEMPS